MAKPLAWYKDSLLAEGMGAQERKRGWTKPYEIYDGRPGYFAHRESWPCGSTALRKEDLKLILEDNGERSAVVVEISTDYFWDWHGKAIYQTTEKLISSPNDRLMSFVEDVGGGYPLYTVLSSPFLTPRDGRVAISREMRASRRVMSILCDAEVATSKATLR